VVDTEARLEGERRLARRGALRGAAAGAVLGAVLSRADLEDILKGAALCAGAGTVLSLGTCDVDAALPTGTEMTLRTTTPIQLRATRADTLPDGEGIANHDDSREAVVLT